MSQALPYLMFGLQGGSQIMSGFNQSANYSAQAAMDQQNAAIARQAGQTALLEAGANEDAQRRKGAGELSRQAAALAESGIGLESGTASDLTYQSALNSELDALNIRYSGKMRARGFEQQASQFEASAEMNRANAKSAKMAGFVGAAASALGSYGTYTRGQAGQVRARAGMTTGGGI